MHRASTLFLTIFLIFLSASPCKISLLCSPDLISKKTAYKVKKDCSNGIPEDPVDVGKVDGTQCLQNVKVGYFKRGLGSTEFLCDKFIELINPSFNNYGDKFLEGTLATSSITKVQISFTYTHLKDGFLFFELKDSKCPEVPQFVSSYPKSDFTQFARLI